MIVVSGMPRSGSSLLMQTLNLLGVPLVGMDDHDFKGNSHLHSQDIPKDMYNRILSHNPKGYWELPAESLIEYLGEPHTGAAIKLLGPSSIAFPNTEHIEAAFVCVRHDVNKQAQSILDVIRDDVTLRDYEVETGRLAKDSVRSVLFDRLRNTDLKTLLRDISMSNRSIARWWLDNDVLYQTVYYESMLDNPRLGVSEISKFLRLDSDMKDAINNIGV